MTGVSRSGFYKWKSRDLRKPSADEILLVNLFEEKCGRYGIRRLKMLIHRRYKLTFNLKKIVRIKRDYELITTIRRKKKMKAALLNGEEHSVARNLLKRDFVPVIRRTFFSTDVTELQYLGGKKAYLSAVKDLATNEVVHFNICPRPTVDLVTKNLTETFELYPASARKKMIIHSDQGFQYTGQVYRSKLENLGISQSMSRKGNCLDNAPIESFFGHLKDEVAYRSCKNFGEVKMKIEEYIEYYNNDRPQWCLKQKTPAEAGASLVSFN